MNYFMIWTLNEKSKLDIKRLQNERISLHYYLCRKYYDDIEIFPYDHFWEGPLLSLNLQPANTVKEMADDLHSAL